MDQGRFDDVTRSLTNILLRRHLLCGFAGAGLGVGLARLPEIAAAKKKRKHKKKDKKVRPNEFGCFEVGDPCKSEAQCCSGICEGKKCRAHDTGTCNQDGPEICVIDPPLALTCNNDDTCRCFGTTAGSIACTRFEVESCADCDRDADCAALGYPPGTVCAPLSVGICAGQCESGMACLAPCGVEFPEPAS